MTRPHAPTPPGVIHPPRPYLRPVEPRPWRMRHEVATDLLDVALDALVSLTALVAHLRDNCPEEAEPMADLLTRQSARITRRLAQERKAQEGGDA